MLANCHFAQESSQFLIPMQTSKLKNVLKSKMCLYLISAAAVKSNRPQVNIADQIAIRSFVLGQGLGKTSKLNFAFLICFS